MDPDDIGHCIVPIPPELELSLVKGLRHETTTIRVAIPSTAGVRLLQLKAAYLGLAQYGLGEDDNCTACITSCVNGAILFFLGIANPRTSALYSFHAWPSNIDDSDRNSRSRRMMIHYGRFTSDTPIRHRHSKTPGPALTLTATEYGVTDPRMPGSELD